MSVSQKKRAANRRNALKSTGPKTVSGKRVSAQNATRHGLSVPLPPQLVEPVQQQLVELIVSDGFDHEIAHSLAEKIIDYERNLLYLQKIYHEDIALANDPRSERGAAVLEKEERQKGLVDTLTDIEQQKHKVELLGLDIEQLELEAKKQEELHKQNQKLFRALNQLQRAGTRMIKSKNKDNIKRIGTSERYFKRASNQLIKALRRL